MQVLVINKFCSVFFPYISAFNIKMLRHRINDLTNLKIEHIKSQKKIKYGMNGRDDELITFKYLRLPYLYK